jgi:hypothetical protein
MMLGILYQNSSEKSRALSSIFAEKIKIARKEAVLLKSIAIFAKG